MTLAQAGQAQGEAWVPSRKEGRAKEQLSPGATLVWPAEVALPDHGWELSKDNQLFRLLTSPREGSGHSPHLPALVT